MKFQNLLGVFATALLALSATASPLIDEERHDTLAARAVGPDEHLSKTAKMLVDAGVHKQQFIAGERWAVEATMVSKGHTHSMLIVGALVHTGTTWDFNSYFYDFINESPQGTLLPDGAGRARIGKLKLEFIAGHKLYLKGRVRPDADTEVAVASIQAKNKKYCKVPVPGVVDGMNCITFVDKLWKEIR